MEEYKRGFLVVKEKLDKFYFDVSVCEGIICNDGKDFYDYYKKLPEESKKILDKYFTDPSNTIEDYKVCELLSDYCKNRTKKITGYPIIYKEMEDTNGNKYGKELLTNRIFPIPNNQKNIYSVSNLGLVKNIYRGHKDKSDPHLIYYYYRVDRKRFPVFKDRYGVSLYTANKSNKDSYWLYGSYNATCYTDSNKPVCAIMRSELMRYRVCMSLDYVHNNANRLEVALIDNGYANDNDIKQYRTKESLSLTMTNKIRKLCSYNNLKEIKYSDSNATKDNSSMLDLINDIESLLFRIKGINESLYNESNREYQKIIDEEPMVENDKYKELQDFYNRLFKSTSLSTDGDEACEFLDNYINKLLDDMINKRFSSMNLSYLTQLHKEFLNNESNYSIKTIQKINGKFNLLYFLYLFNYRDNYNNDEISSSYINSSIKGIANVIEALHNLNVIKYVQDYKLLIEDLPSILKLIDNIELNDIEKVKELIK